MIWEVLFFAFLLFVVLYGGFGLILYLLQPKFLYCPAGAVDYTPKELGLAFEEIFLTTSDNVRLHGWYVPSPDAKYTLLFCHGNGGNIMHRLDSIQLFYNIGLNCLIFDYRGYGRSEGKTTEQGTYLDATAAYEWLRKVTGAGPEEIIAFGRSLGGSVAAELARKVDVGSLVVESTFTSYVAMGRKVYWYMPVRWFARYRYDTLWAIRQVRCPVMIIHSVDDEIVPFEFGQQLYAAANEPKEFVEISGGHNDGFVVSAEVYKAGWQNWLAFLKEQKQAGQHAAS
jgi:fermentation-respiration switch protein FrsA (DUF1100 family)